jgi:AcrR family transcriptional regulator
MAARKDRTAAQPRQAPARDDRRGLENRREALLEAAAELFGSRGYEGTSMRDIASAVGMLPGSVYYHFRSKDDLLLEVHREGVRHFHEALDTALAAAGTDPRERFLAASRAHLATLLDGSRYAQIVTPEFTRSVPPEMRREMIADRDRYEARFIELIDALPLPPGTDRRIFRLGYFGAINWAVNWFAPGQYRPEDISDRFCELFLGPQ